MPAPPGWMMQVFEVVPGLFIATRLESSTEYATLEVDTIVDLEDWEMAWVPPVPLARLYVSFPMDDGDEVDPERTSTGVVHRLVGDPWTTGARPLHGGHQPIWRRRGSSADGDGPERERRDRSGSSTEGTKHRRIPGSWQSGLP